MADRPSRGPVADLLIRLGWQVIQGVVVILLIIGVFTFLGRQSVAERRQTLREAQLNRTISCIAIISNPDNPSHDDPRILDICADVGVRP